MAHTTRYGNRYTDEEWAETQAYFKQEKLNDDAISAKIIGVEKFLRRMLSEEGLNDEQAQTVVGLFRNDNYETANIQWTKESRKATIDNLWSRWNEAMSKIYNEAMNLEDALEVKKLAITENDNHDNC